MSVDPDRMSIEQLKECLRELFSAILSDSEAGPSGRPHYKARYVEQLLRRNEEFLDTIVKREHTVETLAELLKVTVNQSQMALHLSRQLVDRTASGRGLPAPDNPQQGE